MFSLTPFTAEHGLVSLALPCVLVQTGAGAGLVCLSVSNGTPTHTTQIKLHVRREKPKFMIYVFTQWFAADF